MAFLQFVIIVPRFIFIAKFFPTFPLTTIVPAIKLLQQLSKNKFTKYIKRNLNSPKKVLFENYSDGLLSGLTENYIRVYSHGDKKLINNIKEVNLVDYENHNVYGELIGN